MSCSLYRGKVHTNEEIKGPFTEAKDDFTYAYDILQREVGQRRTLEAVSVKLGNQVFISIGGIWLCITRDGLVEIGEGGA